MLNDRMAYVTVSRARKEALIYTDSTQNLRETLNRATNKEMALEETNSKSRDLQQDRDGLRATKVQHSLWQTDGNEFDHLRTASLLGHDR